MPLLPVTSVNVSRLEQILADPRLTGAVVSATVSDAKGRVLFSHAGDAHVVPASNEKLLTATYALSTLGPDYRPETRFWRVGNDVWIDSPGDPLMSARDLRDAKSHLGVSGRGTVYVREAYRPGVPPTWELDDLPYSYGATVTAMTVDRGEFELWSDHSRPTLRPRTFGVKIVNQGGTAPFSFDYDPILRRIVTRGKLSGDAKLLEALATPAPDEAAASYLGAKLEDCSSLPPGPPNFIIKGQTTLKILDECLPPSDNNLAENLLLMTTARLRPISADPYGISEHEITRFLTTVVGIAPSDLHIVDGSGMSRQDLVTTRAIVQALAWCASQPTSAEWMNCLATPTKGTIAGRLKGLDFRGKTGSLNMESSLSGYLMTGDGNEFIVSIVINQCTAPAREMHAIQDAFVRALVETPTPSG